MSRVYVIAEAGVNHNGKLDLALRLVDIAAEARADAVKFQTFRAERLATASAPLADYQRRAGEVDHQFDMLRRLELSEESHLLVAERCRERGIAFLSSPFDEASADFLAPLVDRFKIPSGEVTNHRLLRHVARYGKPMIVSTGMTTLAEVERALDVITEAGPVPVTLLHCTSLYPAPPGTVNLRAMNTLAAAFRVPVGFSDHTQGLAVAFAAIARGATILEKHFTLDRKLPGPDHAASLEPSELCALVEGVRQIEIALGDGRKRPAPGEREMARTARRSLVITRDSVAGTVLRPELLDSRRPGTGISPDQVPLVVGRVLRRDLKAGSGIQWEDL